MAIQPLQFEADFNQLGDLRVAVALGLQTRLLVNRLLQRYWIGRVVRHQLAQPVNLPVGHLQHAADIAQHSARLQLSEGNDLRDLVAAIFLLHIADDLITTRLAEVDIKIRHGDALWVQKPLKQQVEAQGIEIGDR